MISSYQTDNQNMLKIKGYRDMNRRYGIESDGHMIGGKNRGKGKTKNIERSIILNVDSDSESGIDFPAKLSNHQMQRSEIDSALKKNAIFMMCIINDHYVIGACIAAFCHRKMLMRAGIKEKTDLVIMCDEKIYDKYHKLLQHPSLFDVVIKIDMRIFPDAQKYNYSKIKYSSWIGASLNKWQIMDHDEYDRIMFVDIALLPSDTKLYDLFNVDVPAVLVREKLLQESDKNTYKCTDGQDIKYKRTSDITYDEYLADDETYGTIHGNLVVIKPDKAQYKQYVEMTDKMYESGIYSIYKSGPDETSLFYFFLKMGIMVHNICHENATIPWDEKILIDISKGYEFSSMFKPWTKPKILCWPEELLWRDVYDILIKVIVKDDPESYKVLNSLFKRTILETYDRYVKSDSRSQQRNYNDKFINRYRKEFDSIKTISQSDDRDPVFDALMQLDSKIHVKFYGPLKTQKLTEAL